MKLNFENLTDEELENIRKTLTAEISRRREIEKELASEELENLLDRINELQYTYGFEISCREYDGSWISSASEFTLTL
jgi:hypothetical protein